MVRVLLVIDRGPLVARPKPVALAVVVRERVIVFQPIAEHQFSTFLTTLPPRRHYTPRRLAALKVLNEAIAFIHNRGLLFQSHGDGILMAITVETDLVSGVYDHAALLRESLQAVSWDEESRFDVVLVEQLQHTADADAAGEEATGDVAGAVLAAV